MGFTGLCWYCVLLATILTHFRADSAETHYCRSAEEFEQNCFSKFSGWWSMDEFWSSMCNDVDGSFVFECMKYQRNTSNACNATYDDSLFVALFEQYDYNFGIACEFSDPEKSCQSVSSCYDNIYEYSGVGYYTFYDYFCGSGNIGQLFTCLNNLKPSCPATYQWYSDGFAIITPDGTITQADLEAKKITECGKLTDADRSCIGTQRDVLNACKPSPAFNNGTISCGLDQMGCLDGICDARVTTFYNGMFTFLACGSTLLDECSNNLDDCGDNADCLDLQQGYSCSCTSGYIGDGYTCTVVEECTPDSCDINAMCINGAAGVQCTCNVGYVGDGITCEDVDECEQGICDNNAACTNVPGSHDCTCNEGYSGNGYTCTDNDECEQAVCDSNAMCRNIPGSFDCTCNEGYFGDGQTCDVVDECTTGQNECDINAICRNTLDSYICFCNEGYTGDGITCSDIDYCITSPCENGGSCADGLNTFACTCVEGYYGPTCGNFDPSYTWGQWGACSVTCDEGVRSRTRDCDQTTDCAESESQPCYNEKCPENPTWSNWNRWGVCSSTCGQGIRQRTRTCIFPVTQATTFLYCNGNYLQEERCSDGLCPILVCGQRIDNYGTWPETDVQNTASLGCLHSYQQGSLTRECNVGGIWGNVQTDCFVNDDFLDDLQEQIDELQDPTSVNENATDVVTSVVSVLEEVTQDADNFKGPTSIIKHTVDIIDSVTNIIEGPADETNAISEDVVESLSNIIDISFEEQWNKESDMSGSDILKTLDEYLNTVTELKCNEFEDNEVLDLQSDNIYAEIGKSTTEITFPNTPSMQGSNIEIPKQTLTIIGLSTVCYSGEQYTTTLDFIEDEISLSSMNGTIIQPIVGGLKRNSDVLAVRIAYQGTFENLDPPVRITLAIRDTASIDPVCVFWDFGLTTGGRNGAWSDRGCDVISYNTTHVSCSCTHLTNFAILMSPSPDAGAHTKILSIVSAVGCAISMVCLLLTIILHCMVWRLVRSDRAIILMNLCVALLLALGIFLAGVNRTESRDACIVIAALIQLFFLAVFFFMLLIGLEIFICVVHVFMTKFRIKILLPLAWLLPVLIVGITLGVTKTKGYGTDEFCWLDTDSGVIWAFIGPAAFVILVNFVIIVIVLKKMASSHVVKSKSTKVKIQTGLRSICVLVPVMGITWFMGLLSVNSDTVAFQYLFCLFNTLQGLFIFLLHCVFNRQIRDALKRRNDRKRSMQTLSSDLRKQGRHNTRRPSNDLQQNGHRRDSAEEDWAKLQRKQYHRRLREVDV